jgi:hypothetical protein
MTSLRNFISNYSPILTLGVAILGLYAMAASIGLGMNVHA